MKRKLLKVIGISFLIFVVLSWLIPVGTYSSGQLTTKGIDPVGLIDLFNKPIQSFVTFVLYGVVFATIGGLYGVMGKTGALDKVVTKMSNDFSGKETKFLVLTVVLFAVLSSVNWLSYSFICFSTIIRSCFNYNGLREYYSYGCNCRWFINWFSCLYIWI